MSETKFQAGDKVEAFGCQGVVAEVGEDKFGLRVNFNDDGSRWFMTDGRAVSWHKEPSLKLIERPKKKVTKTMYQPIVDRGAGLMMGCDLHANEGDAKRMWGKDFIALGPAITFEVEE